MFDDAIEHLNAARRLLTTAHDIEDTDHPQVQRPNRAMRATNAIDEALSEVHSIGLKATD